jgi:hypothetical protein
MSLLYSHKRTEFGKPNEYRGPMCASEKSQWCGEPCFAGAAISIGAILPQIPIIHRPVFYIKLSSIL